MRYLSATLLVALFATPALAEFQGPASSASPVATVRDALAAPHDDTKACLEGNIIERLLTSSDKYTFKDATGTMTVEIDDEVFYGVQVTPTTKVRICGEVDKEYLKPNTFDAKNIQILSK